MGQKILVINGGSSSIKYQLLTIDFFEVIASGICERIFIDGKFSIKQKDKKIEIETPMVNHEQALKFMIEYFQENKIIENVEEIVGVGHRIVHGGKWMSESKIIDKKIIKQITDAAKLAPLHNLPEIEVINVAQKVFNKAIHVASFDTSFHATIPDVNSQYAVPKNWVEKYDVKRYGAHGTSYQYITSEMSRLLSIPKPNLIICHIGNGASICVVRDGLSHNTSMGLTPLEGLVMGTRCGDIDPAIVSYIANEANLSHQDVTNMLNKQSGIKALTGFSDFREVTANLNDPQVKLAFDIYCKRITDYIVKYLNELEGKCDGIVFTAGVGENTPKLRFQVIHNIFLSNINVDKELNEKAYDTLMQINRSDSSVPIYVMRTNEELMIAREVKKLITKQ